MGSKRTGLCELRRDHRERKKQAPVSVDPTYQTKSRKLGLLFRRLPTSPRHQGHVDMFLFGVPRVLGGAVPGPTSPHQKARPEGHVLVGGQFGAGMSSRLLQPGPASGLCRQRPVH